MIRARYISALSIFTIFDWVLSILIGSALTITYFIYFSQRVTLAAFPYFVAFISIAFTYLVLNRLIHPIWRICSTTVRYSIMSASVVLLIIVAVLTPSISAAELSWQSAVGSAAGQPATIFQAQSWGNTEQQILELHASENPNDPKPNTTFGVWRVTARLPNMPGSGYDRLRFYVTQPDWAVIDQQTGQPYQGGDGVTILFKARRIDQWQTVQQVYLDLLSQPDERRWQAVDVNIPSDSEQLAVEVQPGRNNAYDRVWITTGAPRMSPEAIVQPARWLSIGFLTFLGLLGTVWSLQTSPGRYVQVYVQGILQQYGGVLTGLSCMLLGYLLIWQRGMYLDDYSIRFAAFDNTGQWKSIFDQTSNLLYPARLLTWEVTPRVAALLPEHELFVRTLITLFVGLNALLLGYLIYKVLGSRLAGTVGGWLFLMPVFTSSTVWVGASTYIFSVTAALLFLHSFWNGLSHRHPWLWVGGGVVALTIMLLFGEAHLAVIVIAGLIGVIWVADNMAELRSRLGRVTFMLIWPLLTFSCLYFIVFRNPHVLETRGGIATDPAVILERAYGFLYEFYYWTVAPGWGRQTTEGFFSVGLATISRSWQGCMLVLLAAAVVFLTALTWRSEQREYDASHRVGLLTIVTGVLWFVIALTIPLALAQYSIYYESRFAYFPLAGIALLVAALVWSAAKLLRRQAWERVLVGIVGTILLIATISTVGLSQAYAARNSLDREQIAAVRREIPSQYLPSNPIFVAVNIDEQLPGDAAAIPVFGTGVLEAPWAGCPELRAAYQRNDLIILATNRWIPMKFSYLPSTNSPASFESLVSCPRQTDQTKIAFPWPGSAMVLYINNTSIPLDKAVLFTYQNGKATAIESLLIKDADGMERVVQFPVGKTLRLHGISTITGLPVVNQPLN